MSAHARQRPFRHVLLLAVVVTPSLLAHTVNLTNGLLAAVPRPPRRADTMASTLRWPTVGTGQTR